MVVKELAESSIVLEMRMWVKTEDYWNAKFYLNENVKYKFDEIIFLFRLISWMLTLKMFSKRYL